MKLVTVNEMIAIEKEANKKGLSYQLMMKNAGTGIYRIIIKDFDNYRDKGILGLIGSGNNGGDALVALTLLAEGGWRTSAYAINKREENDSLVAQYSEAGGKLYEIDPNMNFNTLDDLLVSHSLLLDGVLGTGIHLPLREPTTSTLRHIKETIRGKKLNLITIAVDCPSGIDCDSGEAAPEVLPASMTITMAAVKQGLLKFPAYNYVGELKLVDIGLQKLGNGLVAWNRINSCVADPSWVADELPKRPLDAHKGTFGTTFIIAGSLPYTGAPLLAGEAAYRAGSGLVALAVPLTIYKIIGGQLPECIWAPLPDTDGYLNENALQQVIQAMNRTSSLLIGPGLSQKQQTEIFLQKLFSQNFKFPKTVIDADGLRLIAKMENWEEKIPNQSILTPHPGEMSALTNLSLPEIQANRKEIALEYSKKWNHIIVLKGAITVVANPNGENFLIPVASPALARAGSGDVLAGLISGYLAQGLEPFKSAIVGCWIHAMAGLSASNTIGNSASVLAGDILSEIPSIIFNLEN